MDLLLFIPVLLVSIVAHEVAHAWQARREGDFTADRQGRITLNPLKHLDLMGSFVVPALLWVGGGVIFGWARPVPVNPANFRDHPWSDIRVSMAGIVANLLLVVILLVVGAPLLASTGGMGGVQEALWRALYIGVFLNLILAFFNLLPIPPLDGSHVVQHLLPERLAKAYRDAGRYGILVLLALVFLVPGALGVVLAPVEWVMAYVVEWYQLWR
jgi:Zn-dependent protease